MCPDCWNKLKKNQKKCNKCWTYFDWDIQYDDKKMKILKRTKNTLIVIWMLQILFSIRFVTDYWVFYLIIYAIFWILTVFLGFTLSKEKLRNNIPSLIIVITTFLLTTLLLIFVKSFYIFVQEQPLIFMPIFFIVFVYIKRFLSKFNLKKVRQILLSLLSVFFVVILILYIPILKYNITKSIKFPSENKNINNETVVLDSNNVVDYFEKNKECWSYYNETKSQIEDNLKDTFSRLWKIQEIWYSPKLNTCYIAYSTFMWLDPISITYRVDDVFTKKILFQVFAKDDIDVHNYLDYIEFIKSY